MDASKPRLLDQVREAIRARHYSPRTADAYVGWIRRFILFHDKRHPRDMGESEVSAFLSALATERHVSASTQNQALSAIVFLYAEVLGNRLDWLNDVVRAKRPVRLPVVLTPAEVRALLDELDGTIALMASLMYGAGLRMLECCELRVKDVDLATREIRVRDGKGRKDRVTVLPVTLEPALRRHLELQRPHYDRDVADGHGWVAVPDALGRKFPNAGRDWLWRWLFPATRTYVDPETTSAGGIICTRASCSGRSAPPRCGPGSPSRQRATRCGTRLRRICWRPATTSGRSRSSWGIVM